MVLGSVIKQVRQRKGLTQHEVCRIANITQGFYSAIENNTAYPSWETLIKISNVFELPVYLLVWGATEKVDIPRNQRYFYKSIKPVLDNIFEETITPKK